MIGRNQVVQMSNEGPWVSAPYCFPQTGQKDKRSEFCRSKRMYVAETTMGRRVVAIVCLGGNRAPGAKLKRRPGRLRAFWMDAVTGTLYNFRNGIAISSDDLFLWDIRKDQSEIDALIQKRFYVPHG